MKPIEEFIPDPKDVKTVLKPGLWVDHQGQMHFCAVTFCKAFGHSVTPENVVAAEQTFEKIIQELYPQTPITHMYPDGRQEEELSE